MLLMRSALVTSASIALSLASCSLWALPASMPMEGMLLTQLPLAEGLELGVYGPRLVHPDEPTIISVLIRGDQSAPTSFGLVLMAHQKGAAKDVGDDEYLKEALLPWASYIPSGLWAPDWSVQWQQLLLQWIISTPHWLQPGPESVFRNLRDYDQIGVAFIIDESSQDPVPIRNEPQGAREPGEALGIAHGVKVSFPLVLKDPTTTLTFWVTLSVNGKLLAHTVTVPMAPQKAASAPPVVESEAPVLDQTATQVVAGEVVEVAGRSKPGTLAVAWLELYDPAHPQARSREAPVRHITDASGRFKIPLPVPSPEAGQEAALVCELHVHTEAPGYKSPQTVSKLRLNPAAP